MIERQMKLAEVQGQLTGLPGEGQPLPEQHIISGGPVSVTQHIKANARPRRRKIDVGVELATTRAALQTATDAAEKKQLMSRIAMLDMQQSVEREASSNFLR